MNYPTMEKICVQLGSDPTFRRKWLIGGLICSLPVIQLILPGYLFRFIGRLQRGKALRLPSWKFDAPFWRDCLFGLVLWVLYGLIPLLFGWLLSAVLRALFVGIGLNFFASTLAWLPLTLAVAVSVPLFLTAINHFQWHKEVRAIWEWSQIVTACLRLLRPCGSGILMFFGLLFVAWPLLGFVFFLGIGPLSAYMTSAFIQHQQEM